MCHVDGQMCVEINGQLILPVEMFTDNIRLVGNHHCDHWLGVGVGGGSERRVVNECERKTARLI